jgi:type II secretory pathway pseudopilin PulG
MEHRVRELRISEGRLGPTPFPFPDVTSIRSAAASRSGPVDTARSHHRREVGNGDGNGEGGYTLVIVVLVVALMSILMTVAVQTVEFQMRREREAELIFRGEQYVEAIRLYRMKYGRYPMRMKEIWEANPRVVRKKWKDPITDSENWGLIFLGQEGRRIGPENPLGGTPGPTETVTYEGGGRGDREGDDGSMIGPDGEKIGPIVGVHSTSCDQSIKIYEARTTYCEWQFVFREARGAGSGRPPPGGYHPGKTPVIPGGGGGGPGGGGGGGGGMPPGRTPTILP